MSFFQQVYDSEQNFSVTCFWDGGFTVELGDDINGFIASENVDTWDEVEPLLRKLIDENPER